MIETVIEDARWQDPPLETLAARAAEETLMYLGLAIEDWDIVVMGCGDTRIAALNADFRGKATPTNVLSWPSEERSAEVDGGMPELPEPGDDPELGDIAIAYDTCLNEAELGGLPPGDHVTHLIVHAILHLLGYDHIRDKDATLMERTEVAILGKMGLPDPY